MLLKNEGYEENIETQQKSILKYAATNDLVIDTVEIDNFSSEAMLRERIWLRGFMRSLKPNDAIIAYDLWSFTPRVDELVKLFECILEREISLHLSNKNIVVSNKTTSFDIMSLLSKQRMVNMSSQNFICRGRPTGRMSRSKFDDNRAKIVEMLEQNISVNEIAKMLNLSRSSLKDYVNSRALKELAEAKKNLPKYYHKTNKTGQKYNGSSAKEK